MSTRRARRVTFVSGDITDLGIARASPRRRTRSRTSSTSPRSRSRSAGPIRRSAPRSTSRAPSTSSRRPRRALGRPRRPVVYIGSIGMFSAGDVDPPTGRLDEDAIAHPSNHYGVYKLANEGTARVYWPDNGFPSVGLRPMTVYGAGSGPGPDEHARPWRSPRPSSRRPFGSRFGGRTLFQYAADVARARSSRQPESSRRRARLQPRRERRRRRGLDGRDRRRGPVLGRATSPSFEPAPLPFPSDIAHDRHRGARRRRRSRRTARRSPRPRRSTAGSPRRAASSRRSTGSRRRR